MNKFCWYKWRLIYLLIILAKRKLTSTKNMEQRWDKMANPFARKGPYIRLGMFETYAYILQVSRCSIKFIKNKTKKLVCMKPSMSNSLFKTRNSFETFCFFPSLSHQKFKRVNLELHIVFRPNYTGLSFLMRRHQIWMIHDKERSDITTIKTYKNKRKNRKEKRDTELASRQKRWEDICIKDGALETGCQQGTDSWKGFSMTSDLIRVKIILGNRAKSCRAWRIGILSNETLNL